MKQPVVNKKNVAGIETFSYVILDVQPEPLPPCGEPPGAMCAYCRRMIPPSRQATPPWHWPGRGLVTNCRDCAGLDDAIDRAENEQPIDKSNRWHRFLRSTLCRWSNHNWKTYRWTGDSNWSSYGKECKVCRFRKPWEV